MIEELFEEYNIVCEQLASTEKVSGELTARYLELLRLIYEMRRNL